MGSKPPKGMSSTAIVPMTIPPCTAADISDAFVSRVEDRVGYVAGGWDNVDAKELIAAVLNTHYRLA